MVALGRATAATVLVYCEKRGQHLLLEGAGKLEEIVMQLLNGIGCITPLQIDLVDVVARIHRWANMTLITRFRLSVPGDLLLRQAASWLINLMEIMKNACHDNAGKLIYWPLESVVTGGSDIYALKAPIGHDHVSWHELASRHTPLIFAFGEINNKSVSEEDADIKWINCTATHDLRLAVFGLKNFTIRQRSICPWAYHRASWHHQTVVKCCPDIMGRRIGEE